MGHFKSFLLLPFKKNGEALIDRISFKEVFIVYSMCWIWGGSLFESGTCFSKVTDSYKRCRNVQD